MTVTTAPRAVDPAELRFGVFISVRRTDSGYLAVWFHERLRARL
ncbi:MAG: hypothetical protein QOK35_764, partial [Pseudonocardiales bacterium]|nr:hypothetical protein [Pseudonocardiales bacterium]